MQYSVEEGELLKKIGNRLKELRKSSGYTSHEDFSMAADISRTQYFRYEKGNSNITVLTLRKILSMHKVSFEEFFNNLA